MKTNTYNKTHAKYGVTVSIRNELIALAVVAVMVVLAVLSAVGS